MMSQSIAGLCTALPDDCSRKHTHTGLVQQDCNMSTTQHQQHQITSSKDNAYAMVPHKTQHYYYNYLIPLPLLYQ